MILYHVTTRRNWPSVKALGLHPAYDQRGRHRVWLCSAAKIGWAMGHVMDTHGWKKGSLILLQVTIARGDLIRHRRGIWWTGKILAARRMK